ncbi:MAG: hypothetical protein M3Q55_09370 [Acidobacteriota bacterium]|nr:hypothetical protein [Acidobacteriota bacterium]
MRDDLCGDWWEGWPTAETTDEEIAALAESPQGNVVASHLLSMLRDHARVQRGAHRAALGDELTRFEARLAQLSQHLGKQPIEVSVHTSTMAEISRAIMRRASMHNPIAAAADDAVINTSIVMGTGQGSMVTITADDRVPPGEVREKRAPFVLRLVEPS